MVILPCTMTKTHDKSDHFGNLELCRVPSVDTRQSDHSLPSSRPSGARQSMNFVVCRPDGAWQRRPAMVSQWSATGPRTKLCRALRNMAHGKYLILCYVPGLGHTAKRGRHHPTRRLSLYFAVCQLLAHDKSFFVCLLFGTRQRSPSSSELVAVRALSCATNGKDFAMCFWLLSYALDTRQILISRNELYETFDTIHVRILI